MAQKPLFLRLVTVLHGYELIVDIGCLYKGEIHRPIRYHLGHILFHPWQYQELDLLDCVLPLLMQYEHDDVE